MQRNEVFLLPFQNPQSQANKKLDYNRGSLLGLRARKNWITISLLQLRGCRGYLGRCSARCSLPLVRKKTAEEIPKIKSSELTAFRKESRSSPEELMPENISKPFPKHAYNKSKCFSYLQLGETSPSSRGSPVHFLVSVGRTRTRSGYKSGRKAHKDFQAFGMGLGWRK